MKSVQSYHEHIAHLLGSIAVGAHELGCLDTIARHMQIGPLDIRELVPDYEVSVGDDDTENLDVGDMVRAVHPDRGWVQAEVVAVNGGYLTLQAPDLAPWEVADCNVDPLAC